MSQNFLKLCKKTKRQQMKMSSHAVVHGLGGRYVLLFPFFYSPQKHFNMTYNIWHTQLFHHLESLSLIQDYRILP
jgi:hypothetical protein